MHDLITPNGIPDVVNLLESRNCCFCGNLVLKRKQMWKYPDGNYMCIPCKTRFDKDGVSGAIYSADFATVTQ